MLQASHEICVEDAQQTVAALLAFNDIVSLDDALHLREGTVVNPMPAAPGPPGPQMHLWLMRQVPNADGPQLALVQAEANMKASMQAKQQTASWEQHWNALDAALTQGTEQAANWKAFYQGQAQRRLAQEPTFVAELVKAWTTHILSGRSLQ